MDYKTADEKLPRNYALTFEGAIGNAYMKMYTPIMPLKDEPMLRGVKRIHK